MEINVFSMILLAFGLVATAFLMGIGQSIGQKFGDWCLNKFIKHTKENIKKINEGLKY